MDKKTFQALFDIIGFAKTAIGDGDVHPDVLHKQFRLVKIWMLKNWEKAK